MSIPLDIRTTIFPIWSDTVTRNRFEADVFCEPDSLVPERLIVTRYGPSDVKTFISATHFSALDEVQLRSFITPIGFPAEAETNLRKLIRRLWPTSEIKGHIA